MGSRGNAEYMGSRFTGSDSPSNSHSFNFKMEAIKKKMQAMKVEKDNACDQADVSEEKMKAARIRAQKGEDEVEELVIKSRQLETELDVTSERLSIATLQLEEKSVLKLQKEVDRLEDELVAEQEKHKAITEELEQTFAEMSGYYIFAKIFGCIGPSKDALFMKYHTDQHC